MRRQTFAMGMSRVSFALLSFIAVVHFSTALTRSECGELGFNSGSLACSSCDKLPEFGLDILKKHCEECCQQVETVEVIKKYPRARLEVCTCKYGTYPQIEAFLEKYLPTVKIPNLQVRYVRGADPIIKMLDFDGTVQEVLAIEKWDTDTVKEFVKTHLIPYDQLEEEAMKHNSV